MAKAFLDGSWMTCLQENPLYGPAFDGLTYTNVQTDQTQVNLQQTSTPLVPYSNGYGNDCDSALTASFANISISPQLSTTYSNITSTVQQKQSIMDSDFARALARRETEYVCPLAPASKHLPLGEEENDAEVETLYEQSRNLPVAAHEMNSFEPEEMRRVEEMAREWRRRCARKMLELATDTTLDATSEQDLLELIAHATASLLRRQRSVPGYHP